MAQQITLKPVRRETVTVPIRSISPLVQHQWSVKAKTMMRDKHAGKKTKNRDIRDPQAECDAAAYRCEDGSYGIPAMAIKSSIISAAHNDLGIAKTLVRKSLFIHCDDAGGVLPIACDEPTMREDCVRVGTSTDLRYRPEFRTWQMKIEVTYDADLLTAETIINLIERAGFGVGVGENRPEKGGDWGRFEVDREAAA